MNLQYRVRVWTVSLFLAPAMVLNLAAQQDETEVTEEGVDALLEEWNEGPRDLARELIEEYGQPDEATDRRLIWHNNSFWKRTEIVNEEIFHNFPEGHNEFLYQTVEYNVPIERASDLLSLSGSLLIDRVRGELTSRGDSEETNLLSINLAHQIVEGQHTPESARDLFAAAQFEDERQDLTERLLFTAEELDREIADPGLTYGARPGEEHREGEEQEETEDQEGEQEQDQEEEDEEDVHPFLR